MLKQIKLIVFIVAFLPFANCFAFLNSTDLFVEGGFSSYYLLEDLYTGGNGKVTLTLPLLSYNKTFDIVAGGSAKLERTSFLTQTRYYSINSDITSYQLGVVGGIKYRIISPFYIYLLGNANYSPYTQFVNHFYLYSLDSFQNSKVDYNMNAGIELKFIYKMFRDFGIGFSLYGAYGLIKYQDTTFLSLTFQGNQGGYIILNTNLNFVYFIKWMLW